MSPYVVECLNDEHDIAGFSCGKESLDKWLHNEGRSGQAAGNSRTHVWVESGSPQAVAYFTITPTTVEPHGLTRRQLGGLRGNVPGYLLAKLALSIPLRGHTPRLGPELLVDALGVVVRAADAAGGRLLVVDTVDEEAHRFYERLDFHAIEGTDRLVMRMSTVREVVSTL